MNRYFDHAACRPPYPEALAAADDTARCFWANPSAHHQPGRAARNELRRLKERFCDLVGFDDGRLVLTSGGTEANNLVLRHALARDDGKRLAIAADVHASAWWPQRVARKRVVVLPLTERGSLSADRLDLLLTPRIGLCAVVHGCNETGVIHDVAAIARRCATRGIELAVDAVQTIGRTPLDLSQIPADYVTFSAHKFGGPHGVGGVLLRAPMAEGQILGGQQEWRLRAGTENLPGLAGAVRALECERATAAAETARLRGLAEDLVGRLAADDLDHLVNGDPATGLPGLVSVSFPGCNGHALAAELDMRGFTVATGSACHADQVEPSRVIMALGRRPEQALGTLRVSMGAATTAADVAALAAELIAVVRRHRALR